MWITEKAKNGNQMIIEIYQKEDGKFYGKIADMTKPLYEEGELKGQKKRDIKNPDENLKNRELIGIDFLTGLEYNEKDDKFENGHIYVTAIGKTFNSYMKLQKDGNLLVKGTIDKSGIFGKKQFWI